MIFIFLLALILFGPKKLPEIGREIGKFMAEFKRASNDFKYQLQNEIEKAGVDVNMEPVPLPGAQQTSSFAQTLLPPAVSSAISEIDSAHERLMKTARMAFDAQNFTLRPPETPTVASSTPEALPEPSSAETSAPPAEHASAVAVSYEPTPVEAVTDNPTPESAPAKSDSAPQSS